MGKFSSNVVNCLLISFVVVALSKLWSTGGFCNDVKKEAGSEDVSDVSGANGNGFWKER